MQKASRRSRDHPRRGGRVVDERHLATGEPGPSLATTPPRLRPGASLPSGRSHGSRRPAPPARDLAQHEHAPPRLACSRSPRRPRSGASRRRLLDASSSRTARGTRRAHEELEAVHLDTSAAPPLPPVPARGRGGRGALERHGPSPPGGRSGLAQRLGSGAARVVRLERSLGARKLARLGAWPASRGCAPARRCPRRWPPRPRRPASASASRRWATSRCPATESEMPSCRVASQ
jgi:hypothetical protein